MKIGVLGTGEVGRALAGRLAGLGHEVRIGSRRAQDAELAAWAAQAGLRYTTFADAARDAELIVNATGGTVSLAALTAAGAENLAGKVLMDVSNPLDFSDGSPKLAIPAEGSVAEQLQQAFPQTRVVKTLQTMNNKVMVEPGRVPGPHNVFVCGDDQAAKARVREVLRGFGWSEEQIIDLGDLSAARQTEPLVMLWIRLAGVLNTMDFNYAILHGV